MSFARNLILLVVIVGIIAGGIFYVTRQDAEYINVQLNLTQYEINHVPTIDNMTAYLVPVSKISEPKGTQMFLPGVTVKIIQNGEDISDWTSVPYTGNGTYKIPVGLWKYPKKGEFVVISVILVDPVGTTTTSVTYKTDLK
jgi:hypothetical protein